MKNYLVHYGYRNTIISTSRNAAKHLQNLGGDSVLVTDMHSKPKPQPTQESTDTGDDDNDSGADEEN